MKKFVTLFVLFCLSAVAAVAQSLRLEATVVDANTGRPLQLASVRVNGRGSTVSNAVGTFALSCEPTDVLHVTYVGYRSRDVVASQVGSVVSLEPAEQPLGEIVVLPIANTIRLITKEMLRQEQKFKKNQATFFYRQTAFQETVAQNPVNEELAVLAPTVERAEGGTICYEFVESFLKGCSAVALRDLRLLTGRYAGLRPDEHHQYYFYSNFFTFSQIEIATKQKYRRMTSWPDEVVPLSADYHLYYDVIYKVLDDGERRLYVITFVPYDEVRIPIYEVTMFVDAETLHVLKFQGLGRNIHVLQNAQKQKGNFNLTRRVRENVVPTDFKFVVNMTEERGFVEVETVFVETIHEYQGKRTTTHSVLYNVGERKVKRGGKLDYYADIHSQIERQGYDPAFWKENEVVRRTPVEQRVQELFEGKQLFGVFK